jgi:Protein of unknown function (DUF4085)
MKFFTSEWWSTFGDTEDMSVVTRYNNYLASITHKLPKELLDFHTNHTLHDAQVKRIVSSFNQKTIQIEFRGWDIQLQNPIYYTLLFSGVKEFDQRFPQQEYVESELGDLGCWEIEALNQGIEIRMLFASEAEFKITFEGFSYAFKQISAKLHSAERTN